MRVLFLNRAFLPDVEATGQYLAELAEDLAKHHDVTVLCGKPNFGRLKGRVFPYRWEHWGAVDVWRAWGTTFPKRVSAGRIINQATFYALARFAAPALPRANVIVSLTDPPFLGMLGLWFKRRWRAPFVLYCQDLYPDVAEAVDMAPALLARSFERVQSRILRHTDRVVALGDDMATRIARKGVSSEKIAVIRHWSDTEAIRPIKSGNPFRARHGLEDKFVVMYSGNFGHIWNLDSVLAAAARLQDEQGIVFVLVGDGSTRRRIAGQVAADRLDNVKLLPYQPREQLSESLSAADLHLIPMRPDVYGTVVPSKIYGILASGTPIAALAERASEVARTVRRHRCGWVAEPGDADALTHIIRSAARDRAVLSDMSQRARDAAEDVYARPLQTGRFRELLENLVRRRRRPVTAV